MVMSLGDRMKEYEGASKNYLTRRTPVIVRIDGRAFHTYTKGFNKPYDDGISSAMFKTALCLVTNVQNCKLAYTQSDEISLLLVDYDEIDTEAWFKNSVQKIVSVSASLATAVFNSPQLRDDILATFDSRAFNIPVNDVNNYFVFRQRDCIRNSIEALAHSLFKQKQLSGICCNNLKEKILKDKNIDWDFDVADKYKYGTCIYRTDMGITKSNCVQFSKNSSFVNSLVGAND